MKKFISLVSLVMACGSLSSAFAQSCATMLLFKENSSITTTSYDANAKALSSSIHTVTKVSKEGETIISKSKVENSVKKSATTTEFTVRCEKDKLKVDMSSMIPVQSVPGMENIQVTVSGDAMEIPTVITVGQSLPDGFASVEMTNAGTRMGNMRYAVKNRKVEAKETITTPAGSFVCYKISSEFNSTTMMQMPGMPGGAMPAMVMNGKIIQWFSFELGADVKTENYGTDGKLTGYMLITEVKK